MGKKENTQKPVSLAKGVKKKRKRVKKMNALSVHHKKGDAKFAGVK